MMFHGHPIEREEGDLRRPPAAGGGLVGPAAALFLVMAFLAGCSSPQKADAPPRTRGTPGSFERQVREFGWSAKTLVDQSDARRSLESDLEDLKLEQNWWKNLRFDVVNLFGMPDARRSLEMDLHDFSGKDDRGHGIVETLQLFGW